MTLASMQRPTRLASANHLCGARGGSPGKTGKRFNGERSHACEFEDRLKDRSNALLKGVGGPRFGRQAHPLLVPFLLQGVSQ